MSRLRFVLILALTVMLDFSSPLPNHAAEALEEFEEVAFRHGRQRSFRLMRDTVAPKVALETRALEVARPAVPLPAAVRAPVVRLARPKIPPAVAESPSAPEAH